MRQNQSAFCHCSKVVHIGVPSSMEEYFQESGRAGRDGDPAMSRVFFNSYDIIIIHQVMRNFVTTTSCRRRVILEYFGFTVDGDCGLHSCCENCALRCSCDDCLGEAVIHTTLNELTIS